MRAGGFRRAITAAAGDVLSSMERRREAEVRRGLPHCKNRERSAHCCTSGTHQAHTALDATANGQRARHFSVYTDMRRFCGVSVTLTRPSHDPHTINPHTINPHTINPATLLGRQLKALIKRAARCSDHTQNTTRSIYRQISIQAIHRYINTTQPDTPDVTRSSNTTSKPAHLNKSNPFNTKSKTQPSLKTTFYRVELRSLAHPLQ